LEASRFKGGPSDEETLFKSLPHARAVLEAWRRDYNEEVVSKTRWDRRGRRYRRMQTEPRHPRTVVEPQFKIPSDHQLAKTGQFEGRPGRQRRAQEFPLADPVARRARRIMLAAGQQHRLPAERLLLIDNAKVAVEIATAANDRECEVPDR
jgi:hypothetical protein